MITIALVAFAAAQGSQGGYGGGGFGGGLGGSVAGQLLPGSEQRFEHILTPGDRTDWPFEAKEGDVFILRAESDVFDPAIEVDDKSGAKIAENDDERPGQQNARVLVYISQPGTYTAHVKNYHSTSGGRYVFFVRKYRTKMIVPDQPAAIPNREEVDMLSIRLKKDEVICFDKDQLISTIVGPDGSTKYGEKIDGGYANNFIRSEQDGVYLVNVPFVSNARSDAPKIVAHLVRFFDKPSALGQLQQTLVPGGADGWRIHIQRQEFLSFTTDPKQNIQFFLKAEEDTAPNSFDPQTYAQQPVPKYKRVDSFAKAKAQKKYVFLKEGDYTLYVRSMSNRPETYQITIANPWVQWDGRSPITARLNIGETAFYRFVGQQDDIARYRVDSSGFDVEATLFDADFNVVSKADDSPEGIEHCELGMEFLQEKTMVLSVHCVGDGGSGGYQISPVIGKVNVLKLGDVLNVKLVEPKDAAWKMTLEKPQRFGIIVKSSQPVTVTVTDNQRRPVNQQRLDLQAGAVVIVVSPPESEPPQVYRINLGLWKPGDTVQIAVLPAAELAKRIGG